jgi:hypothetical protein
MEMIATKPNSRHWATVQLTKDQQSVYDTLQDGCSHAESYVFACEGSDEQVRVGTDERGSNINESQFQHVMYIAAGPKLKKLGL